MEVGCDKPIDRSILAKHVSSVIDDILPGISADARALHIICVQKRTTKYKNKA